MAIVNYGKAGSNLTINGVNIDDFGVTDPAITFEDIEPRSMLQRGLGGRPLRLDNPIAPKRMKVALMAGSTQAGQLNAIAATGADFRAKFSQTGSRESKQMFDGILVNVDPVGRAGKTSVTDEVFIFEFNDSTEA